MIRPGLVDITSLQTSFNLWDGIRDLQRHRWHIVDLQYLLLAGLTLFSLWIAPPALAFKMLGLLGGVWLLLMPATRQFFSALTI